MTKHLDDRLREILRLRFEADLTQGEIGERLGISQMHVSRLLKSALTDLKERWRPAA
jgi:RNA polymerase sigma-B factor